jgi:hypothetical protein
MYLMLIGQALAATALAGIIISLPWKTAWKKVKPLACPWCMAFHSNIALWLVRWVLGSLIITSSVLFELFLMQLIMTTITAVILKYMGVGQDFGNLFGGEDGKF